MTDKMMSFRDAALSSLIGIAIALIPFVLDKGAYLHDDAQAQFVPAFMAIGSALRHGTWPDLTLQIMAGGNLLGEYQYTLLNPISLAAYGLFSLFDNLDYVMAAVAVLHYAIMAPGVYYLARLAGARRSFAFLAVLTIATNGFLFYWYASDWPGAYMASAYFPWCAALLLCASKSRPAFAGAVVACYLAFSSGWPHVDIAVGLFALIVAVVATMRDGWRSALPALGAAGFAGLMAMPALLPLAALGAVASRVSAVYNDGYLVPNLFDVLNVSSGFHRPNMFAWFGYGRIGFPPNYVAWYVIPCLALFSDKRPSLRNPALVTILAFGAICLLASAGPAHLGPLRFPMRFVPFFQLAVTIGTCVLLSAVADERPSRRGFLYACGVILVLLLYTVQTDTHDALPEMAHAAMSVALVTFIVFVTKTMNRLALFTTASAVVLVFLVEHIVWPSNPSTADWGLYPRHFRVVDLAAVPRSYEFFAATLAGGAAALRQSESEPPQRIGFGNVSLLEGYAGVNGYSPIGNRGLARELCVSAHGIICREGATRILARDPATGAPFADLLRVDRITSVSGDLLDAVAAAAGPPWHRENDRTTVTFERGLPNADLPGTVSYVSPGLTVAAARPATVHDETLRVGARDKAAGTIIFARIDWPGYRATFDGRPIHVAAHANFLVSVRVPPGPNAGVLDLQYRPPHWRASWLLAALGLAGTVLGALRIRRRR